MRSYFGPSVGGRGRSFTSQRLVFQSGASSCESLYSLFEGSGISAGSHVPSISFVLPSATEFCRLVQKSVNELLRMLNPLINQCIYPTDVVVFAYTV